MSIEVLNVSKSFGNKKVLNEINFTFSENKINMIIGASGSGKTVLLKCLAGLLAPDEGKILYEGRDLSLLNTRELRNLRHTIGMLFQGSALFDSMTVLSNVEFPLRMFTSLKKNEIKDTATEYLIKVGLENSAPLYPAEISGGMKKRVGIARALVLKPKYLFADEPNSGLDPETAEKIDLLLNALTEELKITTVAVSHDMKSVLTIADNILFIHHGRKEWEGSRNDLSTADNQKLKQFVEISGVANSFLSSPDSRKNG